MFQSQDPRIAICTRLHAISHVFASTPTLLDFFFNEYRTALAWGTASATLRNAERYLDIDDVVTVQSQ